MKRKVRQVFTPELKFTILKDIFNSNSNRQYWPDTPPGTLKARVNGAKRSAIKFSAGLSEVIRAALMRD
jgi:hypothetical protein